MRKKCARLLAVVMLLSNTATWCPAVTVQAEEGKVIVEEIGSSIESEEITLLGEPATNQAAPVNSYPIEITGNAGTEFDIQWNYSANTPQVVSFFDYNGYYNVAYMDGEYLKIQRYNASMSLINQLQIPRMYTLFGNVTCDSTGNYYVVWGQTDTEDVNCVTISVAKYDYQGNFVAECAYNGYATWDDYWGTQQPFRAGNCSMTINNGVLAVNYARNMYSGHQSNYIIYVDCSTMTKLSGANAYCSHSFDQRIITLSDGGYLALNHGDAYSRGFMITKIAPNRNELGEATNFHFREGANRDHGYNETYAQLGGIAETDNAYVFCGSSERTLSVETAPTNQDYCGYSEARDLFIQILKKDFTSYSGANRYRVSGSTREATGTAPDAGSVETELFLSGTEKDYGVLWLTDYEDTFYAVNPKVVSIGEGQVAVIWEKRTYADQSKIESYYAVLDEDGNVVRQPLRILGANLAGNIDPTYKDGKIYWTTSDANGDYIHCLEPLATAQEWIQVTGVNIPNNQLVVNVGSEVQLNASVLPANATNKGLQYKSSRPYVATIDENGKITGVGTGTTTITVTSKENSEYVASCQVTVNQLMTELTLSESEMLLYVGNTDYLQVNIEPYSTTNQEVEWSSSDEGVVSFQQIYSFGAYITAQKAGTATIFCKAKDGSGLTAGCTVTVRQRVERIQLDETQVYLEVGDNYELNATALPEDAYDKSLNYASTDTGVANVDQDGRVTAQGVGRTYITINANDGSATNNYCLICVQENTSGMGSTGNNDNGDTGTSGGDSTGTSGSGSTGNIGDAENEDERPIQIGDLTYENGRYYFYENGIRVTSKEAYVNGAWRWFDADGSMAVDKDVYQQSSGGKWVRYNENGEMIKGEDYRYGGWYYFEPITGIMMKGPVTLEDGRKVFYDTITGQKLFGEHTISGQTYVFDVNDGHLISGPDTNFWVHADGKEFWYENWQRQGWDPANEAYRGKEIYDPVSDAWYWLDNVQHGGKAVSKDVYQESYSAYPDREDGTGKWVRYDENGHMIKGWQTNAAGTYYFETITGAMAKGNVTIDGVNYYFDVNTGIRQ